MLLSMVRPKPKSSPTLMFEDDSSGATVAKPPRTRMSPFSNATALDAEAIKGRAVSAKAKFFIVVSQSDN